MAPTTSSDLPQRGSVADDIKMVALQLFAREGYGSTSIQQIADAAGTGKSNVLYHFSSKEVLLEAILTPVVSEIEQVMLGEPAQAILRGDIAQFAEQFVDLLVRHPLEVNIFISQGQSLAQIPSVARANDIIRRLIASPIIGEHTSRQRIRHAVALGGAAYSLVAGYLWLETAPEASELRDELVAIVTEILSNE